MQGFRILPLNYNADFVRVALSFISIVARRFPEHFSLRRYNEVLSINLLIGDKETEKEILEGKSWRTIYERWREEEEAFKDFVKDLRLY